MQPHWHDTKVTVHSGPLILSSAESLFNARKLDAEFTAPAGLSVIAWFDCFLPIKSLPNRRHLLQELAVDTFVPNDTSIKEADGKTGTSGMKLPRRVLDLPPYQASAWPTPGRSPLASSKEKWAQVLLRGVSPHYYAPLRSS